MISIRRAVTRTTAGAALVLGAACSDSFVEVTNPDVIDAATVDPTSGATTPMLESAANKSPAARRPKWTTAPICPASGLAWKAMSRQ